MDYGDNYDFSDWFSDDYGNYYIPSEGSSVIVSMYQVNQ